MVYKVTMDEAQKQLQQLVEAALNGEEVYIVRDGEQVIRLTPVRTFFGRPTFGSAKGMFEMSDDFDEPLDEFREYME
jgi:prevent-host-death family protein